MNIKVFSIFAIVILFISNSVTGEYNLVSPNRITKHKIRIDDPIYHSVYYKEKPIILDYPFSITMNLALNF